MADKPTEGTLEELLKKVITKVSALEKRLHFFAVLLIIVGIVLYMVPNVEMHPTGTAVAIVGAALVIIINL
jgi:hypothetical protein